MAISGLNFQLQKLRSDIGIYGSIGLVGFLGAILVYWHTNHLTEQMPTLIQKVTNKNKLLITPPKQELASESELILPLEEWYEQTLKSIILLTEKHSVTLVGGSYTVKTIQNTKIKIVEITFPLSGSYLQIKHFLAELLNTIPNASLQAVRFSQTNHTSEMLDSEAVLLLYFLGSTVQ